MPSRVYVGRRAKSDAAVTVVSPFPSAPATINELPPAAVIRVQARCVPSGDQVGDTSATEFLVTLVAVPPVAGTV